MNKKVLKRIDEKLRTRGIQLASALQEQVLSLFLETLIEGLKERGSVTLIGFGRFKVVKTGHQTPTIYFVPHISLKTKLKKGWQDSLERKEDHA